MKKMKLHVYFPFAQNYSITPSLEKWSYIRKTALLTSSQISQMLMKKKPLHRPKS